MRKKCKVRMTAVVTAYIYFDSRGEAIDFDELDEIREVEDFEILDIIH